MKGNTGLQKAPLLTRRGVTGREEDGEGLKWVFVSPPLPSERVKGCSEETRQAKKGTFQKRTKPMQISVQKQKQKAHTPGRTGEFGLFSPPPMSKISLGRRTRGGKASRPSWRVALGGTGAASAASPSPPVSAASDGGPLRQEAETLRATRGKQSKAPSHGGARACEQAASL